MSFAAPDAARSFAAWDAKQLDDGQGCGRRDCHVRSTKKFWAASHIVPRRTGLRTGRQAAYRSSRRRSSRLGDPLGPVYGDDKAKFFAEIDVLLFPTQYKHESWGIVLNEALAAGVPVITNDRGCSSIVVGDRAGLVVPDPAQFVASATRRSNAGSIVPMSIGQHRKLRSSRPTS